MAGEGRRWLDAYLTLERRLVALDFTDVASFDALWDAMDAIWYRLSDEDRAVLDARGPE